MPKGRRPVKEFLDALPDDDAAVVVAAMRDVLVSGLVVARHLRGDVYEVRADADRVIYRILFATEGRYSQVLLALEGFKKKTQKAPPETIAWPSDALRAGVTGHGAGDGDHAQRAPRYTTRSISQTRYRGPKESPDGWHEGLPRRGGR